MRVRSIGRTHPRPLTHDSRKGHLMKIENLSVSKKLGLGFAGVLTVISVSSGVTIANVSALEKTREDTQNSSAAQAALTEARFRLTRQENSLRGWILSRDKYYLERVDSHRAKFKKAIGEGRAALQGSPAMLAAVTGEAAS